MIKIFKNKIITNIKGVDARIGNDFDKKRTKSRLGNLCVYAWAGFTLLFKKKPKIGHIL